MEEPDLGNFPSVEEIVSDASERTKFLAFASSRYAQEGVLFLCAVWDAENTSPSEQERETALNNTFAEYVSDSARHRVPLQVSTVRDVEKKLQKKKPKPFQKAYDEVAQAIAATLLQDYRPEWVKNRRVDFARASILKVRNDRFCIVSFVLLLALLRRCSRLRFSLFFFFFFFRFS
jgi:hypothetical protein